MSVVARSFRWGLAAVAFSCLWLNLLDDPPLATDPYVQNVTSSSATVARIGASPHPARLVVTAAGGEQVAEVVAAPRRRHALVVDGLEPGSTYRYTWTGDGGVESGSLRTAPGSDDVPIRFAFLGDSGDQPWWVWLQRSPLFHLPARWRWLPTSGTVTGIGAAVASYAPEFVLHLGDVVYPYGRHAHYSSGFFRPFAALLRTAPVYPVIGNHDMVDASGQQILANFAVPPGDETGDGRCYSFAWGALRIVALDCNTHVTGDRFEDGHPSLSYLRRQLASCTEPWLLVASHYPIRSASKQRNRADLMLHLLPELAAYGVSLYLSGHDHCYQRFGPSAAFPVPLVVSGGGGKDLYEVRQGEGAERAVAAHHWCAAEVAGPTLRIRAIGLDGATLDDFALDLPSEEVLDRLAEQNPGRAARIRRLRP